MVVRLRRISGSSSITKIFFILLRNGWQWLALKLGRRLGAIGQFRQPDGHPGAFTDFAFDVNFSAMQIDAPFDDDQAQTGARAVADVSATMKGREQPFAAGLR